MTRPPFSAISPLVTPWFVTRSVYCGAGFCTRNVFLTVTGGPASRRYVCGPKTTVSAATLTSAVTAIASVVSRLSARRRTQIPSTVGAQNIGPPKKSEQQQDLN
ncbi:MAG: hypothetical protein AUH72_18470 [Acidobacteria bacterium 13_1_40CM_4_65_8]|nr:MAG: hypothetical protein AUH72_18470 [Acidobacteria bacterium 13_1_40CM_4_65_8]